MVLVVYWLYLAVHAVDQGMARLLTPERYGGAPSPWTPKLTQQEVFMYTLHGENDGNPEQYNTMDEEKMKQATDTLLKKRLPHGPGPTPEQRSEGDPRRRPRTHSRAQGSTDNVQDEMEGMDSDSDEEMMMEAGENAPLQKRVIWSARSKS